MNEENAENIGTQAQVTAPPKDDIGQAVREWLLARELYDQKATEAQWAYTDRDEAAQKLALLIADAECATDRRLFIQSRSGLVFLEEDWVESYSRDDIANALRFSKGSQIIMQGWTEYSGNET